MTRDESISVTFTPADAGSPSGKLADAAVYWTAGPFAGLQLMGFAIWERRAGGRNLTMPARQYSVNGERRSFALLRPQPLATASVQDSFREWILDEYRHYEQTIAILADEANAKPETMEQRIERTRAAAYPDVKRYDNPDDAAAAAKRGEPICLTDLISSRTSPAVAADIRHEQQIRERLTAPVVGPRADGIRF